MNESRFARICLSVAVFAIVALAALAVARADLAGDGLVDPFHGASHMPGDPANVWPSQRMQIDNALHATRD